MPGAENSSSGASSSGPAWTSWGSRRSSSPVVISRSTREARSRSAASVWSWTTSSMAESRNIPVAPTRVSISAANQSAIRNRIGSRATETMTLRLQAQAVARATNRVDQPTTPPRFEFVTQAHDVDVDDVRLAQEVKSPDPREDQVAREHLARVAHEELQQLILARRQ